MKNNLYRYTLLGITSLTIIGGFGGCGKPDEEVPAITEVSAQEEMDSSTDQYPVTIEHAFGETVIESKPERIAAIGWGNQDVPLALGAAPVGMSRANFGVSVDSPLLPWTEKAYKKLKAEDPVFFDDTDGVDFEAVSDVNPDIILCTYSGVTQEEYLTLSEIAPVIPYKENAWETFWREQALVEAASIGMKEEGEQLVEELDILIAEKSAEYGVEGKTAAFFFVDAANLGSFYVYLPSDPRAAYLTDLGMEFPQSVEKLGENESGIAVTLSAEAADQLDDIDVIIAYGDDSVLEAMQADALIGSIPAVKNGAVVMLDSTTPLAAACNPSVLSIPDTIDEYLGMIQAALEKSQ